MSRTAVACALAPFVLSLGIGCASKQPPAPTDLPGVDVTAWSERTELYMEHPPLVAGQTARFAVHLTKLADFTPVTTGRPSLELVSSGGSRTTIRGSDALRPGAFRVEGHMPPAGTYRWALIVEDPADRHELGTVTVYPDTATAAASADANGRATDASAISYLKEQQWTVPFATAVAREAGMPRTVRAPATVTAVPGGDVTIAAPVTGRLAADALPSIGTVVRAGQVLARFEPRLAAMEDRATLVSEVAHARAAVEAARAEQARAERLLGERAVPARRLEEARRGLAVAEADLQAAEARIAQRDQTLRSGGGTAGGNLFLLRAPIAGRVAAVTAAPGAAYDERAPLFRIVRTDRVVLDVQVPASDAAVARTFDRVAFEVPGRPEPWALTPLRTHSSGVIDPATGALPVHVEVPNPTGELLVGQVGTAVLYLRDRLTTLTVPASAVLIEAGRPFVFVQVEGESFARRAVEIGARDGDRIGLTAGVRPGERVVTRGAYDVQLASAARGLPAEGHVH